MLSFLSKISVILPIFFFIFFFKRNRSGGFWVIFVYCILSFITDNAFTHQALEAYSFYIFSTFTVIEYTLFTLFLYRSLKEKVFKIIMIGCSAIFYFIAILNFLTDKKNLESFDSMSASLEASLIIVYSIFFFYEQIKDPTVFYIYYLKKFWIVIALLIYLSSTLFLFIYAATFTSQQQKTYWGINNISDVIKNLLFTISFTRKKDKKQQNPLESVYTDM